MVTRRGQYPSATEAGGVERVHRRIMEEIARNPEEARRVAASHLAASQALPLDQFDDAVVSAAQARQRQAVKSPATPGSDS